MTSISYCLQPFFILYFLYLRFFSFFCLLVFLLKFGTLFNEESKTYSSNMVHRTGNFNIDRVTNQKTIYDNFGLGCYNHMPKYITNFGYFNVFQNLKLGRGLRF